MTVQPKGKLRDVTWNHRCKCGKRYRDHNVQDLHNCKLTQDENQEGLITD